VAANKPTLKAQNRLGERTASFNRALRQPSQQGDGRRAAYVKTNRLAEMPWSQCLPELAARAAMLDARPIAR
jgi:hypothetical protein